MIAKYFRKKKLFDILEKNINNFNKKRYFNIPIEGLSSNIINSIYAGGFGFKSYEDLIDCINSNPYDEKLDFLLTKKFNRNDFVLNILHYNKLNYIKIVKDFILNNPEKLGLISNIEIKDYSIEDLEKIIDLYLPEEYYSPETNFITYNSIDSLFDINEEFKINSFSSLIISNIEQNLQQIKKFLLENEITTIILKKDENLKTFSEKDLIYGKVNEFNIKENSLKLITKYLIPAFSTKLSLSDFFSLDPDIIQTTHYKIRKIFFILEDFDELKAQDIIIFSQMRALGISCIILNKEHYHKDKELYSYMAANLIYIKNFEEDFFSNINDKRQKDIKECFYKDNTLN